MITDIYLTLITLCMLGICICTIITDFRHGKIYNRHLIIALKIGLIIQFVYISYAVFCNGQTYLFFSYLINFAIYTVLALCLYYFDIWAAGDAKYVIAILLLLPVSSIGQYRTIVFHGLLIFMLTFSLTFGYLMIESVILFLKEPVFKLDLHKIKFQKVKDFIFNWIIAYSVITIIYHILAFISIKFFINNIILIRLIALMIIFFLMDKIRSKLIRSFIVLLAIFMLIMKFSLNERQMGIVVEYKMVLIVLAVMLIRLFCSRFNYKKIKTLEIEAGMVLSAGTYLGFSNSRVKGLPMFRTESIHSKITEEEAESIRRWSKSKYGQEDIYIVRQLPFAPFISLGAIGSLLFTIF